MKIILLGAQGCGKGTQAAKVSAKYNIPHISTGDIFRENMKNQTELGKLAQDYMNKGQLVPDEVTNNMVADRLKKEDGFILDGYPRNLEQAEALAGMTTLDYALDIEISDEEAVKRISGRRTCDDCGAVYHTFYKKPETEGICDKCQGELKQREDDNEETVQKRLAIYHEKTKPLIDYYKNKDKLIEINGEQPIADVFIDVDKALGSAQ